MATLTSEAFVIIIFIAIITPHTLRSANGNQRFAIRR